MVAVHASLSVLLPLRPMHFGHRAAPPPAHHAALAAEGEARGADELFVLAIGDWGGIGVYPYVTPAQLAVRDAMAAAARGSSAGKKLVLAVGDNFYFTGVASAADPRFQQTFEDVYVTGYPELSEKDMWRLVAGNHDYYGTGEISAQLAYSNASAPWHFPSAYYSFTEPLAGGSARAHFVMIDTVLLSVGEDGVLDGAEALARSEAHWAWLRAELAGSDADFLIVGGHYPVWSAGEHGSTPHLVDRLRPLLLAHNVSAYFAGHDHCAQAFVDGGVHHHGVGGAHLLNYGSEHLRELPDGILAMYLASTVWPANVFKGTFATVAIGARAMRVTHYDSDGNALITLEQLPRERSRRAERPAAAAQPQPETRRSMSLVTPTIAINGFNERDRTR